VRSGLVPTQNLCGQAFRTGSQNLTTSYSTSARSAPEKRGHSLIPQKRYSDLSNRRKASSSKAVLVSSR
jgi:hypothetical protein